MDPAPSHEMVDSVSLKFIVVEKNTNNSECSDCLNKVTTEETVNEIYDNMLESHRRKEREITQIVITN